MSLRQRNEIQDFMSSLERWVKMQEKILETFRDSKEIIENGDRLDLIQATRIAFNHMVRTLKAFDQWLQDPFITSHIPRDQLLEVWKTAYSLLEQLLELDIKHTSEVMNIIYEASKNGKLNPITSKLREAILASEERPSRGTTLSI